MIKSFPMFYTRDLQAQELSADSAYRAWLISRQQAPIVHHCGNMHWKRLRVSLRQLRNHIRAGIAALHMALVADKMRRARQQLARLRSP